MMRYRELHTRMETLRTALEDLRQAGIEAKSVVADRVSDRNVARIYRNLNEALAFAEQALNA